MTEKTQYQERTEQVMQSIVDRFRSGDIPEPLATMFIVRKLGIAPMGTWSWNNQLLCAMAGCLDARGYKQWQAVDRNVIKGERARGYILVPLIKKVEDEATGEEVARIYGFKTAPVFDISQTEGDPLAESADLEAEKAFIANLPMINVAERLGVRVTTYGGQEGLPRGRYSNRGVIALGVENVDTWLHELMHAADDRLGNLKEVGQHWRSETVAQFGAATLATLLGLAHEANLGKTYSYIEAYAEAANLDAVTACMKVLERTCQAIDYLLDLAYAAVEEEEGQLVPA